MKMAVRNVGIYQRAEKRGSFRPMLEESKFWTTSGFHPTEIEKIHVDDQDERRPENGEAQVNYLWAKMALVQLGMVEETKKWEDYGSNPKLTKGKSIVNGRHRLGFGYNFRRRRICIRLARDGSG